VPVQIVVQVFSVQGFSCSSTLYWTGWGFRRFLARTGSSGVREIRGDPMKRLFAIFGGAGLLAAMAAGGARAQITGGEQSAASAGREGGSVEAPAAGANAADRAQDGVPRLVQFSATLKDALARPVSGVASVTFAIYAEQEGGAALWSETQNVLADSSGHYSVLLGAATSSGVPAELFGTGQSRWLGVTVARQPELPRVLLASVPYALKAGDADTLGGLPASAYVTTQSLAALTARPATTVVTGGTSIIATGAAQSSAAFNAAGASQLGAGFYAAGAGAPNVETSNASAVPGQSGVTQATPSGSGTTNYLPLWTSSSALGNSILFQTNSRIGVGTTTPVVTLDVNGDSIFRGSFQLVPQGTATASTGQLSHSYQWEASTYNSSTKAPVTTAFGFRATPQGNNTATPTSSLDLYYGPGGGTLADTGFSFSNAGIVTFAPGQTFTGSTVNSSLVNFSGNGTTTPGLLQLSGATLLNTYGSPENLFLGVSAGGGFASTSVGYNTGIGFMSLYNVSSGAYNVALGPQTLEHLTSGNDVTAIGMNAGLFLTDGSNDTVVGAGALATAVSGSINNTAVGTLAMGSSTAGSDNTAVGYIAGEETNGSDNTLIGVGADTSAGVNLSTALGCGARVTQSSSLVLGGTGEFRVNVGVGTSAPISLLDVESAESADLVSPSPALTLGNNAGGMYSSTSVDFNPDAPSTTGTYNPYGRFSFADEGNFSGAFVWYNNKPGAANNGLQQNMTLDAGGNLTVRGNLVKGGGSFKIDDPIDPAGKYLSHSFVESPDMMNLYNGIVTLDAHGRAEVVMPDWFSALNRDFRYTLTAIGSPAPKIYVAEQMNGNKFKIAGGKKGQQISWMVTGIRQDAWANAHRIPTEEVKPADEQGHYLHPELFGAGEDKAVGARAAASAAVGSGSGTAPANGANGH
jgi:trimeric autotransporter adhesin